MKVKAVIGANFGDEGKGKVTNAYAKNWADIVVRYNSGCQAAHTVVTDDFLHAFGHLGSASAHGVPTYLSKYFVVNPALFLQEYDHLHFRKLPRTISPIYVDGRCIVSTVYDVIVNQMKEIARGSARHGSCGVGFHETIVRSEDPRYRITVNDLREMNITTLTKKLEQIRDEYVLPMLDGITITHAAIKRTLESDATPSIILRHFGAFLNTVEVVPDAQLLRSFENVVFEGAQGLLLDENHKWFPYVTHSTTGCTNILRILEEIDITRKIQKHNTFEGTYVSRCYMTRHGAGPFPTEQHKMVGFAVIDPTNKPNEFQGTLRLGYLDVELMRSTVRHDVVTLYEALGYGQKTTVHFTCMDQIKGPYKYVDNVIWNDETTCSYNVSETSNPQKLLAASFGSVVDNVSFSDSPYTESVKVE